MPSNNKKPKKHKKGKNENLKRPFQIFDSITISLKSNTGSKNPDGNVVKNSKTKRNDKPNNQSDRSLQSINEDKETDMSGQCINESTGQNSKEKVTQSKRKQEQEIDGYIEKKEKVIICCIILYRL